MSAFPESGRSDKVETAEIKGSFRPEADIKKLRATRLYEHAGGALRAPPDLMCTSECGLGGR